jgi:hypothetical protein
VSNLQTALSAVESALHVTAERISLDKSTLDCLQKIDNLRIQASLALADIYELLKDTLKNDNIGVDGRGSRVSKRAWIKRKRRIGRERSRIKQVTESLMISLMSLNVLLGTLPSS